MFDLSKYDKYLMPSGDGIAISDAAPPDIRAEMIEIDKQYFDIYGEHLFQNIN